MVSSAASSSAAISAIQLIVGKAAANLGKELVHIANDCHHTGSAPGQFVSLSLSAEEEKGDSEVQLCLCL